MDKIVAIIVTYNPNVEDLKQNVSTFNHEVDYVIIVDNASSNNTELLNIFREDKYVIILNNENYGIAKALNIGLEESIKLKADFVLTMDQDSKFLENSVDVLKDFLDDPDSQNVAMVGPLMRDLSSGFVESIDSTTADVRTIITSGALCRVSALQQVNGWDSSLFIDAVDFDICYKLLKKNYRIVKLKKAILNHHLGESEKRRFIIPFLVTHHSPLRVYYTSRNTIVLFKKYFGKFPKDMLQLELSNIKKFFAILLFEKEKAKKIQLYTKGFFHGVIGKKGKL
ncbi:glycosyltransferase family 2 protein [Empedobacter falsenii]|uniref:Glycosyltransferase family 2 protein n=1 Tax=Empedobacter falsenii TaxID=343874 RepID=A0A7H9DX32_9FLAO|nr:glycosyltransferase family 2 protein [Empedobacter falsenii]QLL59747.1 glycosyltransferase family 2 protein [Empedobacter falsenii]